MVLSMLKKKVFVNLVFVAVDWFSRLSITSSNATTKAIKKTTENSDRHVLCWTTMSKHLSYC